MEEFEGENECATVTMTPLPPYAYDANEWFIQVEAIFRMLRITSQRRKFASVMQRLPADIIPKISDMLIDIPEEDPYDYLKNLVIKRTGRSEEDRIEDTLRNVTMGDKTPTQLLQFLKRQLGTNVSEKILRSLWLERLPRCVKQIIAPMTRTADLSDLAESADLVFAQADLGVHAVRTPEPEPQGALQKTLADLQRQIEEIQVTLKRQERDRTPSRVRNREQSRNRVQQQESDLCWYHLNFGNNAKKCRAPCKRASVRGNWNARE